MLPILSSSCALTALSLRGVVERLPISLASILPVALAVLVLLGFPSIAQGLAGAILRDDANVAIVTRGGADENLAIAVRRDPLTQEQALHIASAPGVARRHGRPLTSMEVYTIVDGVKRSNGLRASVALRGVGPAGLHTRDGARIVQGRMFRPGARELIVGQALAREIAGLAVGQSRRIGAEDWTVVGMFEAPGTRFESELWGDVSVLQDQFLAVNFVNSLRVVLDSPAALPGFKRFVEADPRRDLRVHTTQEFVAHRAGRSAPIFAAFGVALAMMIAIGAAVGTSNAVSASALSRARELTALGVMGFPRKALLLGTLGEAIALTAIGGLVGLGGYLLALDGRTMSMAAGGTIVVFRLGVTPLIVGSAIALALLVGMLGGALPAVRTARRTVGLSLAPRAEGIGSGG